jgi:hypothetical protein
MSTGEHTVTLDERRAVGCISRRLSPNSFITDDPEACATWLRALNWIDQPRHSRGEHARLTLTDATAIIYASSGLVIILTPGYATLPRGGAR